MCVFLFGCNKENYQYFYITKYQMKKIEKELKGPVKMTKVFFMKCIDGTGRICFHEKMLIFS